jgi:hypothetical protein
MTMLFNPNNLEYGHFQNGEVKRFAGNNVFGGADEYNGHPNVIDVLAPTPEDQYKWLSDFVSVSNQADNRYAFLPMLYPDAQPSAPARLAKRGGEGVKGRDRPVAARRDEPRKNDARLAAARRLHGYGRRARGAGGMQAREKSASVNQAAAGRRRADADAAGAGHHQGRGADLEGGGSVAVDHDRARADVQPARGAGVADPHLVAAVGQPYDGPVVAPADRDRVGPAGQSRGVRL